MPGGWGWRRLLILNMATYILGAGFSKSAGFPLGAELFPQILTAAKARGLDHILQKDLDFFIDYKKRAHGKKLSESEINLEEFISYLDIEHYLTLEGSDHWSGEGNKSQMAIKNLIALVLYIHDQRVTNEEFELYESFVARLEPGDWIFTFNYDTILEKALRKKKIPFRLFPYRYAERSQSILTDNKDEIVVLKMHGSIDWFDKTYFDQSSISLKNNYGQDIKPFNKVFTNLESFRLKKLVDSIDYEDSLLNNIYILENLEDYFFENSLLFQAPLIISPSYNKLVYLNPLKEFWWGFNRMGGFVERIVIIGFSLPDHDEYIRQPLYQLITNFQYHKSISKFNLKMIDYKKTEKGIREYKKNYRFINPKKTDFYFDGFNKTSLDVIFSDKKTWI
jgi:hypothetical protein